jgi:23S rRNA pseudouridine955/2504/2580 synthase
MTASGSTAGSSATWPMCGFNIVSRWSRTGQLRVDGARAAPGDRIAEGQMIRVPPAEAGQAKPRPNAPPGVSRS